MRIKVMNETEAILHLGIAGVLFLSNGIAALALTKNGPSPWIEIYGVVNAVACLVQYGGMPPSGHLPKLALTSIQWPAIFGLWFTVYFFSWRESLHWKTYTLWFAAAAGLAWAVCAAVLLVFG